MVMDNFHMDITGEGEANLKRAMSAARTDIELAEAVIEAIADHLGQPSKIVRPGTTLRTGLGMAPGFGGEMGLEMAVEEALGPVVGLDISRCETVRDVVNQVVKGAHRG